MLTIDGVEYSVPIISVKRKAEALDKYAERNEQGQLQRELIGIFINISIEFGTGADPVAYAALWNKITEATEFHTVSIPDGNSTYEFECYFSNIADTMFRYRDPQAFYKDLTLNMISRNPTKVPA